MFKASKLDSIETPSSKPLSRDVSRQTGFYQLRVLVFPMCLP